MSSAPTPSPQRPTKPGAAPPRPAGNSAAKPPGKPPQDGKPAPKAAVKPEKPAAPVKAIGDTSAIKPVVKSRTVASLPGTVAAPTKKREPEPEKEAAPKRLDLKLPEWQSVARGLMLLSWGWAGMNMAWLLADVMTHFFGGVGWLEPFRQYVLIGMGIVAFLVYVTGQGLGLVTPEEAEARPWAITSVGFSIAAALLAIAGWFLWQSASAGHAPASAAGAAATAAAGAGGWPTWYVMLVLAVLLAGFLSSMLYMRALAAAINDPDLAMQSGLVLGAVAVTALILGIIAIRGIPPALNAYRGIFVACQGMVALLIVGIQWGVAYAIRWRLVRW